MNRLRLFAKPLLAGFLCLVLAAELLLPDRAAPLPPQPALQTQAGTALANVDTSQWANTVLARPLFNANRRPVQALSTAIVTPLPRLSAIVVSGGARRAIFAGPGPLPVVVNQGGQIDGYQVVAILPDTVKLAGPDGHLTLRPQFGDGSDTPIETPDPAPSFSSDNPPPPPPPVPTAASRLDDDPI